MDVERQQAAIAFLNEHAFKPPLWLIDETVSRRFEPHGSMTNISRVQGQVLSNALRNRRMQALEESALTSDAGYSPAAMLADLRAGIWSELSERLVVISPYRQQIQTEYVSILTEKINQNEARRRDDQLSSFLVATIHNDLSVLKRTLTSAMARTHDPVTLTHLEQVNAQIERHLN